MPPPPGCGMPTPAAYTVDTNSAMKVLVVFSGNSMVTLSPATDNTVPMSNLGTLTWLPMAKPISSVAVPDAGAGNSNTQSAAACTAGGDRQLSHRQHCSKPATLSPK